MPTGVTIDQLSKAMAGATDVMSVRRVYGEPFTVDGLTIVPAARFSGGGGGGGGESPAEDSSGTNQGSGLGMGFGTSTKPAGAFVIRNGEVSWQPAVDRNLVAVLVTAVLCLSLLVVRSIVTSVIKR